MAAIIRIDRPGPSVGTNGRSRDDGVAGELITVSSMGPGTSHLLSFRDHWPPPTGTPGASSTIATPTLTPISPVAGAAASWTFTMPIGATFALYGLELNVDGELDWREIGVKLNGLLPVLYGELGHPDAKIATFGDADIIAASTFNAGGSGRGWATRLNEWAQKILAGVSPSANLPIAVGQLASAGAGAAVSRDDHVHPRHGAPTTVAGGPAPFSVLTSHGTIFWEPTTGDLTANLFDGTTLPVGASGFELVFIHRTGTHDIIVAPFAGQTIGGAASDRIQPGSARIYRWKTAALSWEVLYRKLVPREESVATENTGAADVALADLLNFVPVASESAALHYNGQRMVKGAGFDVTLASRTWTWLAGTGTAPPLVAGVGTLVATYWSA